MSSILNVYIDRDTKHVAMIHKQTCAADNYRAEEPWLLLHDTGRIDRFARKDEAVKEAIKSYAPCTFNRT